MQRARTDALGNVAHANDVAVSPFVAGIAAGAKPTAVAAGFLPARVARHFTEIVSLGGDTAGAMIASHTERGFEHEARCGDAGDCCHRSKNRLTSPNARAVCIFRPPIPGEPA